MRRDKFNNQSSSCLFETRLMSAQNTNEVKRKKSL